METEPDASESEYSFDATLPQELHRLMLLEVLLDPATTQQLRSVGVSEGWRCLEIGAGKGSIASWLCRCVGTTGRVVATDLDTRFLDEIGQANLEVRQHNVLTDYLETEAFDLVHSRLVLDHLPDRALALQRMAAALRPGGWLVLEGFDWVSAVPDPAINFSDAALFTRVQSLTLELLTSRGADIVYGRRLLGELRRQGLTNVEADGQARVVQGGSQAADWWRLTFEHLYQPLLQSGELVERETKRVMELVQDPEFIFGFPVFLTARGQRPLS